MCRFSFASLSCNLGPRAAAAFILLLLPASVRAALDPAKAITQYIHQSWQTDAGLPENSVSSIAQTLDGYLWAGTENGLVRFDGVKFTVFDKINTSMMPTDFVTALKVDHNGALWVGTVNGVITFEQGRFKPFKVGSSIWKARVTCFYEDERGQLWIGTDGAGVLRKSGEGVHPFTQADGLADDSVFAIAGDGHGNVWIGTQKGLTETHVDQSRPTPVTAVGKTAVHALQVDREGNLWVGTYGSGLFAYEAERWNRFTTKDGLTSNAISCLYRDEAGTLWIGTTDNGLDRLRNGHFDSFTAKDGLPGEGVASLFADQTGEIGRASCRERV